jgi:hypothetical protein
VDIAASGTTVRLQFDIVLVQASRVEITLMQVAPFALSSQAAAAENRLVVRLAGSVPVA